MKVSELTNKEIENLTDEQTDKIVFGGLDFSADFKCNYGIVLGSSPEFCIPRARAAAKLFKDGKISRIIVSGGVKWDTDEGKKAECYILRDELIKHGISESDIICENNSETTMENMAYSTVCILKDFKPELQKSAVVITAASHLKRSLNLANRLLPSQMKIFGAAGDDPTDAPGKWMADKINRHRVTREIPFYKQFILSGWMDDIEF